MSSTEMEIPLLTCLSCKKKRRMEIKLKPCKIDDKLTLFVCSAQKCLYPLNAKNLHKFIFKEDPSGTKLIMCSASEVPDVQDIFHILMERNKNETPSKPEKLPGSKEVVSSSVLSTDSGPVDEILFIREGNQEPIEKDRVFPMWENKNAFCWLHSTLCLLVHSSNLKYYFKYGGIGDCLVKEISVAYDKAVLAVNFQNLDKSARSCVSISNLEKLREKAFNYLQPLMMCERGQEASPVFAIMLLLRENKKLRNLFLSKFYLELKCDNCGYEKVSQNKKSLVSITGRVLNFNKSKFTYIVPCIQCQDSGQKVTLQFLHLPPLLLMHFVSGLPNNNMASFDFQHDGHTYVVKGFVQYSAQPTRHFVSWIRSDKGKDWMCCDDLNPPLQKFTTQLPAIPASEIHIVMWEQRETRRETNLSVVNSRGSHEVHVSESESPPLITVDDSDSEDCKPICVVKESTAASQKFVCANTDFNKSPSKEVCSSIDESHILGKEDSKGSKYMSNSVAGCNETLTVQKTKMVTRNTLRVPSSSESLLMSVCNAQLQNTRKEVLRPSKNLNEEGPKAVVEMTVSRAEKKPESTICDVTSGSKNETGVGESENLSSPVVFKSVTHAVEGCTDSEKNTNDTLCREENNDASLSQAVEDMSRSNHETSKMNKKSIASHFQTTQLSEHSYASTYFGNVVECSVVADRAEVEMYAEKYGYKERDANKGDCCSQSATSLSKTSVKAESHNTSKKATFPVGKNDVETEASDELNNISTGVVMSQSAHNIPFKKISRKRRNLASTRSPSTEQTEASVLSSPVSGHDSCTETIIDTGKVFTRSKSTMKNMVQTDTNTPVTSDVFTSSITAMDQSDTYSGKENTNVMLNDISRTKLDSLAADFKVKKISPCEVISPISSLCTAPSADDGASSGNKENASDAVLQHAEDLKTQHPNNLGIPSVKAAGTELKTTASRQVCRSTVSSVTDLEKNKDSTKLCGSDLQKTLKSGDLSNILPLRDLHQDTTSNDENIKGHTATEESFYSSELASPKHSTLKKKPCAKVIGQRKTFENVVTIPEQVTVNENKTSKLKKTGVKNEPNAMLEEPDNDVLQGSCFQSKSVVDDSRHLHNPVQQDCMNYKGADSVCKQKVEQKCEPDSAKFGKVPMNTQPFVPECHVKAGVTNINDDRSCSNDANLKSNEMCVMVTEANVDRSRSNDTNLKSNEMCIMITEANDDRSCSNDTNLKSNEMCIMVTEANSLKPSSGGTDIMKPEALEHSINTAKTCAESKSLSLKTSNVSHNAKENVLIYKNITAVFHHIPKDAVDESANKISGVPCPVGKSKHDDKKKHEMENPCQQVCVPTNTMDFKKLNVPVTSAQQRTSKRRRKSAYCNEVMCASPEEQYAEDREFFTHLKAMICEHSGYPRVLNESQESGNASPEKDLGVVVNSPESASRDLSIGQKSRGRKRKCLKAEGQNEDKSPSLPENSSQPGTANGIVSEKKTRLRMKSVRFKVGESNENCLVNEETKAATCSPPKKVSQSAILEDQNATTPGETHFEELKSSLSSGDNSICSQTGDNHPAKGRPAAAKDNNTSKVTKKRLSKKNLLPKPAVPIKSNTKGTSDAVVKITTRQAQPSKPSAIAHGENQHAASNSDISSPKKKSDFPKTLPFLLSVPLHYSQEDLSLNFQLSNYIPPAKITSVSANEGFSAGMNK